MRDCWRSGEACNVLFRIVTRRIDVTATQSRSALVACTATWRGWSTESVQARDRVYLCIGSALAGGKAMAAQAGQDGQAQLAHVFRNSAALLHLHWS